VREAYPDFTAFDPKSEYYDRKSKVDKPIWQMVDVRFVERLPLPVTLSEMRRFANAGVDSLTSDRPDLFAELTF